MSQQGKGRGTPWEDFPGKLKNLSSGVVFVAVESKDRIESSATGKTFSHCSTGSLTEAKASLTDSHKIPLNLSTFELPVG